MATWLGLATWTWHEVDARTHKQKETHDTQEKSDQLGPEAFPDEWQLQEKVGFFDRLDCGRPSASVRYAQICGMPYLPVSKR